MRVKHKLTISHDQTLVSERKRRGIRISGRDQRGSDWGGQRASYSDGSVKPPTPVSGYRDLVKAPLEQKLLYFKETVESHMSELSLGELKLEIQSTNTHITIPTSEIFRVNQSTQYSATSEHYIITGGLVTSSPVEDERNTRCKVTPPTVTAGTNTLLSVKLSDLRNVRFEIIELE